MTAHSSSNDFAMDDAFQGRYFVVLWWLGLSWLYTSNNLLPTSFGHGDEVTYAICIYAMNYRAWPTRMFSLPELVILFLRKKCSEGNG